MIIKRNYFFNALVCTILISFFLITSFNIPSSRTLNQDAVKINGSIMYCGKNQEVIGECYGIDSKKTPDLTFDYILIDSGYSFKGQESYTKIATYGIPYVFASKNFSINQKIDALPTILGVINNSQWSDIGIKSLELGDVKIAVPYNYQLSANVIASWFGPMTEDLFISATRSYYQTLKPDMPNLMFESYLINHPEYKVLDSNLPNSMLKFDLYQNNDFTDTNTPTFAHMYDASDKNIRDINDYPEIEYRTKISFVEFFAFLFVMGMIVVCGFLHYYTYTNKKYTY